MKDLLPDFVLDAFGSLGPEEQAAWLEALVALGAGEDVAPVPGARARLLEDVSRVPLRYAPFFGRLQQMFDLDSASITELFGRFARDSEWELARPGVELLHFQAGPRLGSADTGLVRMTAGLAFPQHRHLGAERVLVLEGGYRDSSGRVLGPGDTVEMPAGSSHRYQVLPDGPLVFALVLEAGIEIEDEIEDQIKEEP